MSDEHIEISKTRLVQFCVAVAIAVLCVSGGVAFLVVGYVNGQNNRQNRDALEIVYTTQLASCQRGRIKSLHERSSDKAQVKFANVLDGILATNISRAKISARDKKISVATQKASASAIATFQRLSDAVPRPSITPVPKLCKDTVLDPTQLAQQVRNHPGRSSTTTAPGKTTS